MKNRMTIKQLAERRNERFLAFMESVKDFIDMSDIYKNKDAEKILTQVLKKIKSVLIKKNQLCELKVDENHEKFIDKIISNIREAGEYIVESELKQTRKDLTESYIEDALEHIGDTSSQSKYLNAANLMVQLAKIKKVNSLNSRVYELEKDLRACLSYNDKIENMKNMTVADEELSYSFVEDTLKECVGV